MQNTSAVVSLVIVWLAIENIVETADNLHISSDLISAFLKMRPTKKVIQETKRTAPELFVNVEDDVRSLGYPVECHEVHTEDGYILTMHRIPRGREENNEATFSKEGAQQPRPPVLLQHGMTSHSDYWVLNGLSSPGLMLADLGYDVWMNNIRGNGYSKRHTTLKKDDPRFWMFSWHEAGYYDIPAAIDHVLNITGQEKLFYFGHSMGNLMFYVAMSTRPEYNQKIRLQIALGPAVYFDDVESLIVRMLYPKGDLLKVFNGLFPRHELDIHSDELITLNHLTCRAKAPFHEMCTHVLAAIWGITNFSNTADITRVTARAGSSTSTFVFEHYSQIILADEMIMMNHGKEKNLAKYQSPTPPKYQLQKVTAPVAIYAADGDYLVPIKGVKRLVKTLPNVVSFKIISEKYFHHLDFTIHPRMNELLWNNIFELMKKY